ncbi:MAG: hypothetical protein M1378_08085 [Bacteroidetes bacterium]|nr:hypothetical protein [Bacteroidota bacterium]
MKKGVLYASIATIVFAVAGCSKYKVGSFVMPSWNTQLSVPLFNRAYSLQEMISKDSVMVSDGDTTFLYPSGPSGLYELSRTQNINSVKIGDQLKVNGVGPVHTAQGPGDYAINSPTPIHFAEVNPSLPVGSTVPVPAIPPTSTTVPPDQPFDNFTSATFSSGELQATIHNGYPATMDFPNGIDVEDVSGNILLTIPIPGNALGAGQTTVQNVPLAGKTLPNNPQLVFTYSSPGTGTTPQTFQSDTLMAITFEVLNAHVSAANAIIPQQPPVVHHETIRLADSNMVQTAAIDSGFMNISVQNGFPFSSPIQVVINSLKDQSGNPLTLNFSLDASGSPGSTYQQDVSLQGYTLEMADAYGNPTDTVRYTVTAEIPGTGGQFVNVSVADSIQSSFVISETKFSSFTGIVHLNHPVKVNPDTQRVNLGDFRNKFSGTITFSDSTKLILDIHRTGGFPWLVHIKLVPSSSKLNTPPGDSVVVERMVYPNQVNIIQLGPPLVNVLNNYSIQTQTMPDRFIISGYVIVNPSGVEGTIQTDDVMEGTASLTMPLDLGISNGLFSDTTKTPVIEDSSTAAKMSNVDSGRVVFEINNGLPVQLSFITQLLDTTTGQVLATLPADSIIIPAATDFNSDGTVRTPMFSKNQIILTHDQAVDLGRAYMRTVFRVRTSPDLATVLFTRNNTISLRAYANFAFKVDSNLVGK